MVNVRAIVDVRQKTDHRKECKTKNLTDNPFNN